MVNLNVFKYIIVLYAWKTITQLVYSESFSLKRSQSNKPNKQCEQNILLFTYIR